MTVTNKLKKFLIMILSVVMAFTLVLFTACDNNDDTNTNTDDDTTTSTEEETVTDYQTLANGDFEFYTNKDTTYPYNSSIKWTRSNDKSSTSALSSSNTSGIIDTSDDAYAKLPDSAKPTVKDGDKDVAYNPRTPNYYGLIKNEYDKEDEDKRVNANVAGSKVLMINNKTAIDGQGTAQKFTSSSTLTVPQNGYAILSMWVKTVNLKTVVADRETNKDYGAYVSITNSVGSETYESILIDNVNTESEWVNLKMYVQGSNINSVSYTVTLGLGKGSKTNKDGYVEGFAYFDNLSFKTYNKAEFEELNVTGFEKVDKTTKINVDLKSTTYLDNGDAKADYVDEATAIAKYTKLDKKLSYVTDINYTAVDLTNKSFAYTEDVTTKDFNLADGNGQYSKTVAELKANKPAIFDANVDFNKDFFKDTAVVNYIEFNNPSSATLKTPTFTIAKESYKAYTFYTQAKITNQSNGVAKIQLEEKNKTAVDVFADIKTVTEEGDYGYWTKYTVCVYNPTNDNAEFTLNLLFGLDKGTTTDMPSRDLPKGYAIVADMQVADIEEDLHSLILTSSYTSKQTVYGKYNNFTEDEEEHNHDEYGITPDIYGQQLIATKPVAVPNFTLVKKEATKRVEAGIVNSKHVSNYASLGITGLNVLDQLKSLRSDGKTYNEYAQAIVLSNIEKTNSAYVTSKATLTANTYTSIIVNLRVTGSAKANVYLTSTAYNEDTKSFDVISIKGDNDATGFIKSGTITAGTRSYDGKWVEVCFYVATGNEDIDYRVEIWNGSREDGSAGSEGTIFIDNVYVGESSAEAFKFDKEQYRNEYAELGNEYKFNSIEFTRVATVKYTNEDGEEAEKTRTFDATEVFAGNDFIKFVSYETIDIDNVIDETTPEEDEETEEETETETDPYKASLSQNLPLLIISGIIALALIIAIIVVIIKSRTKKRAKDTKKKEEYYSKDARAIALQKIAEKKAKINVEKDEEETEYDYEEAENIGNEEVVEEVVEEETETTEEVIDLEELEKEPEVLNETEEEKKDNE